MHHNTTMTVHCCVVLWCSMLIVLWCNMLCCIVVCYAVLCCIMLWCIMLCHVVVYYAVLYCGVLCCVVLWCIMLWYIGLYCGALFCVVPVLWCIILCCTCIVVYYAVLYLICSVLCCVVPDLQCIMLCCTWFVVYCAVLYMYCNVFLKSCSAASGHMGPCLPAGCLSTATRAGYGWLAANGNCNLLRWQQSHPRSEQHAHWPVMPEEQYYILLRDMWVFWSSLDLDLDLYIAGTIIYFLGESDAK